MSFSEPFSGRVSDVKPFTASVDSLDRPALGLLAPRRAGRLALVLILADLCAIALGFGLAVLAAGAVRAIFGLDQVAAWPFLVQRGQELVLLAGLAIGIFAFGGLYRRSGWELDEIRKVVTGIGLVAMFDATLQFVLVDHNSRLWAVIAYPLVALVVISLRMAVRALPAVREAMTNHVILLGGGTTPELLVNELRESRAGPVNLLDALPVSQFRGRDPSSLIAWLETIGRKSGVLPHRLQTVLAPAPGEFDDVQALIALFNAAGHPYSLVLPFTGLARNGLSLQKVTGADMVLAEMRPSAQPVLPRAFKRGFDLVAGLAALVLAAPLLLAISALLACERGPVLFTQIRVGRGRRRFRCFKFRTMRPDAEACLAELLATDPAARAEWHVHQKLRDDPRVTRLGRFLRKTSLDELPQLFNVLGGDMSLVGPRPIIAPEIAGYPGDRAYYENPDFIYYTRCTPGITGLWQVSGRSGATHDERVRLDRWYARNWSFWLDLMIMFKTIRVVLFPGRSSA